MPTITLIDTAGQPLAQPPQCADAQALLWATGVRGGCLQVPQQPASALPHLQHAQELLALEHRFGSTRTQYVAGAAASAFGVIESAEHTHDDVELRIVLAGELALLLRAPRLGGWLMVRWQALEWMVLPPQLPHARWQGAGHDTAEWLQLHVLPGGWRAGATGARLPPGALRIPTGKEMRRAQEHMRNRSSGVLAPPHTALA